MGKRRNYKKSKKKRASYNKIVIFKFLLAITAVIMTAVVALTYKTPFGIAGFLLTSIGLAIMVFDYHKNKPKV